MCFITDFSFLFLRMMVFYGSYAVFE